MPADATPYIFGEPGAGTKVEVAGAEHSITLAGGQTGGTFSTDMITLSPGWAGPPPHVHQSHEETFIVLAGRVAYQLGDQRIIGTAGSTLYVPRGVRHAFANPHGQPGPPGLQALFAKYDTVM